MKFIDPNTPGGRLKAARIASGQTQIELAERSGYSRTHITKMERNSDPGGRGAWEAVARTLLDHLLSGAASDLAPGFQNGDEMPEEDHKLFALFRRAWVLMTKDERGSIVLAVVAMTISRRKSCPDASRERPMPVIQNRPRHPAEPRPPPARWRPRRREMANTDEKTNPKLPHPHD